MRHLILLILLLSIFSNSTFASSKLGKDTSIVKDIKIMSQSGDTLKVQKYFYNDKVVKMISYFMNGKLESIYHFKNGLMDGEIKEWSKNGQLIYMAHRVGNIVDGSATAWYDNGAIKTKTYFINNKGLAISYYKNGELKSIETLSGDGIYIGLCQYWYSNGNLSYSRDYSEEIQKYYDYYSNGKLRKKGLLLNGYSNVGTWKFYSEDGILIKEEIWNKGVLKETKKYDEQGKLIKG